VFNAVCETAPMPASGRRRSAILDEVNDHLDNGGGALLTGEIGVGKSHLARAIEVVRSSDHVELLIGSPAIRAIPFAAIAHLVPDRAISDPLRLLQLARRALTERAGSRNLVVIIDDLDQVDTGTLALIHQLAVDRAAAIVATVRSSEAAGPQPTTPTGLWTR